MLYQTLDTKHIFQELKSSSEYFKLSKKITCNEYGLKKKKIVILSSFTADVLENFLIVELAKRGVKVVIKFLPINQFEQQIYNNNSELYKFDPDTVILLPTIEDFCKDEIGLLKKNLIKNFIERYKSWISELRKKSDCNILVSNLQVLSLTPFELDESQNHKNLKDVITKYNLALLKYCKNVENCFIFDLNNTIFTYGSRIWTDVRFFYIGKIRQSLNAQIFLSSAISRTLSAIYFAPKKCIILDADNTLWGGVVGEEGLDGIELSEFYPGNVYKEFHRYLLRLRKKGVILAIVSKNNENDVLNTLKKHKDSLLKPKHISCYRINWLDKAKNIKEVAKELNIGLDAIVFIDDNPVEREWVKKTIPEVIVPDLPSSPIEYISSIESLEAFDFLQISDEDKNRPKMYYQEKKRKEEKEKICNVDDFLKGLRMEASVENINEKNLKRVIQLLNKTNQFNLTVKRHNESELKKILNQDSIGLTLRLKDKFGDSGLVALAIAYDESKKRNCWKIDSFLLSCRVLGRQVEDLLLSLVSELILADNKNNQVFLEGEFIKGKKNEQVSDFFPKRDFKIINGYDNKWGRNIKKFPINRPKYIRVNIDGKTIRKKT